MRPLFSFIPRQIRVAIFLTAVAVILLLTLAPNEDVPGSGMIWDKAAHSMAYGLLTLIGLFMSTHRRWMVALGVWGLGIGIEIAQGLMPFGREGDWRDALANSIGIVLAYGFWAIARRFKPK